MNMLSTAPDPRLLQQWQSGFRKLNEARLERAKLLMPSKQSQLLDLLPLLLHLNHPQLPGFVDHTTPAKIEYYNPSSALIDRARTIFRALPKQPVNKDQTSCIAALYLMGSLGSLAQSRQSDLDLWLCLKQPLPQDEHKKLAEKCRRIERWADEQNVELHIFIMDLDSFGHGQDGLLDDENCGSTQHQLLLDEFYRSSILLTGRMPRWWIIPVDCQTQSAADAWWQTLIDSGLINAGHWIHPGHVGAIPVEEFLGAGLWQLSKGLKSPYKSLLKLLLYRQYAEQFPSGQPLCQDLKALVHQGCHDPEQCDPYVHLLQRVLLPVLDAEQVDRANLIRRAFYLKTGIKLSYPKRQLDDWRYQPLQDLVQQWGWDKGDLIDLDNQDTWAPNHILQERNALVAEMLGSYRALVRFNQKQQSTLRINQQDILLLGHQLAAAFDSRPGKIQSINPNITSAIGQDSLTLIQYPGVWQLAAGRWPTVPDDRQILKQSPSLIELLAFCWSNGLIKRDTRIFTLSSKSSIERYELLQLSASVGQTIRTTVPKLNWNDRARPTSVHIYINVAHDPMASLTRAGMHKVSNQMDPLSFGSSQENLIQTIDVLVANSWNEWEVTRLKSTTEQPAVTRLLEFLMPMLGNPRHRPSVEIHCFSVSRAASIRQRLNSLLHHLLKHLRQSKGPYLFKLGSSICWFDQLPTPHAHCLEREDDIWPILETPASGIPGVDPHLNLQAPLSMIFRYSHQDAWQLFYRKSGTQLTFYLVDQNGALMQEQIDQSDIGFWMLPTLRMLNNLRHQWLLEGQDNINQLALYELVETEQRQWRCLTRNIPESSKTPASIDLKAVFDRDHQPTIYCNQQEFSIWRWGDQLYSEVARLVQSLRQSGQLYPVYLSGISLPDNRELLEHWRCKRLIEQRLFQAMKASQPTTASPSDTTDIEAKASADSTGS